MTADRIRADYPTLENIASTFDREQERIQQVQNALSQHVDILRSGGWVSDAADTFYREMDDELLPSVGRMGCCSLHE
jgi:WXG100 family type VII secretion target